MRSQKPVVVLVSATAHSRTNRGKLLLAIAALAGMSPSHFVSAGTVTDTYTGPASGTYSTPGSWSTGFTPNNGNNGNDYNVVIDGSAQNSAVSLDISATIDNLTLNTGDSLKIANSQNLNLVGTATVATINGGGSLSIASTGSYTDLLLGAQMLTVTNTTITLSGAARIRNNFSGTAIFNNSTGIIQGETSTSGGGGTFGNGDIAIINGGTINASSNGNILSVNPASLGGLINTGTMEATNGGTLQLNSNGAYINTGGTITAAVGSTVQLLNGAAITGGNLTSTGTGIVLVTGSGSSITNVTTSGALNVQNSGNFAVNGTIINNGALNLQSLTDAYTDLLLNGDTTLSGTGTVTLTQAARIRNNTSGTATLTIGASQTIQGETTSNGGGGSIGNNDLNIVNNGIINANSAGNSLLLDPANTVTGLINNKLLEATNGGTLILTGSGGGGVTNTGANINAATGSIIQLNGISITGGMLNAIGTGTIQVPTTGSSLNGLTKAGTLNIVNSQNLTISGTINNTGAINLQSTTDAYTDLLINGNTTLAGTGSITMVEAARIRNGGSGTPVLTVGPSQTISGETSSNGGGGSLGNNDVDLVNNGIINANISGAILLIDPAVDAGLINNNLIEATSGGTVELTGSGGGTFTNTGATITAGIGSSIFIAGSATITGGTLSATGTGTISVSGTGSTLNSLTKSGQLNIQNGQNLVIAGAMVNTGDIGLQSTTDAYTDLLINGNTSLAGTGTITFAQAARIRNGGSNTPVLTIGASQTIQGETSSNGGGGSLGNNDVDLVNNGTINANSNGNSLNLDPANDAGIINNNILEATNSGILLINGSGGGAFNNAGGATITAGANSSVQLINGPTIIGGTLNNFGSGAAAGTFLVTGTGSSLVSLSNSAPLTVQNSGNLTLSGTIANTGSILLSSTTDAYTDLLINGNVTLNGTGTLTLQQASRVRNGGSNTGALTIGAGQIVSGETSTNGGGGSLGNNDITFFNQGTVNANVNTATLIIDPASTTNAFVNAATGLVEASNGGTALLSGSGGGAFTNNGTFDVENASTILVSQGYLTNFSGTTLTGGIYKVIASTGTATLNLDYNTTALPLTINAADVTLSGTGSAFAEINSIATNNGQFRLMNNRSFTTTANFANNGLLQLGGGTFDVASASILTNAATGTIQGFGTINPRPANSGTVEATGGTLTLNNGVGSTGTVQIDSAATLSLSSGAQNSATNFLVQNGTLVLGTHNVVANNDYTNANFGNGNSFNAHANVTGTGQLQASGNTAQGISVNSGAAQATATVTIPLGNFHVGSGASATFAITNTGTTGPVLRGALQTAVNGGNITAGITGTGTTAGNYGPLALGASTNNYTVAYTGTMAGTLTGQTVHVLSNFDNVTAQNLNITGTAYRLASPSVSPTVVNFGILHINDSVSKAITVSNTDPTTDSFSESLDAAAGAITGSAKITGSVTGIAAGASNALNILTSVDTTTTGVKTGTAMITLSSDGTGSSGLGLTSLSSQVVAISATVDNYALPILEELTGTGSLVESSPTLYTLNLGTVPQGSAALIADLGAVNNATGPADTLAGSFGAIALPFSESATGPFSGIGAGQTFGGPDISLGTASVGNFSSSFTFSPRSQNSSNFDQALSTVTVNVNGSVTASVPEPASMGVLIAGGCFTLSRRKSRRSTFALNAR